MNDEDYNYEIVVGEPYVGKDWQGGIVILQDEQLFRDGREVSFTERLVNPDPSDAEVFRIKLKNPWDTNQSFSRFKS